MRNHLATGLSLLLVGGTLCLSGVAHAGERQIAPGLSEIRPDAPEPEPVAQQGRDPFRPFRPEGPQRTALELAPLSSFVLRAMVWEVDEPRAIVALEGRGEHTLQVGTRVGRNEGVVTRIDGDCVFIEERIGKEAEREERLLCLHFAKASR